jgi:class 3 adenylate cyclase
MHTDRLSKEVETKLIQGLIQRSSQLYLFFIFGFLLFGGYTYPFIEPYNPGLQLWDNLWPRIAINCVPFFLLHKWLLAASKTGNIWTLRISFVTFPIITSLGAMVYVWPTMAAGHPDVFYALNATNIYAMSIWFIYLGLPLRFAFEMTAAFALLFFLPLFYVLRQADETGQVLKVFLNDISMATAVNLYCSWVSSKLRIRLIHEDIQAKEHAAQFLGRRVSEAIFENRIELLRNKSLEGFILAIDLRGYSEFMLSNTDYLTQTIMDQYHESVAEIVDRYGGFIHKTAGDGHLISFGLMDEADLSDLDIPEVDLKSAQEHRRVQTIPIIVQCFEEIGNSLERLISHHSGLSLKLAGGLDYGSVMLKVVGSEGFRKEYDFQGQTIIRAVRLENFSRIFFENIDVFSSVLVISPTAAEGTPTLKLLELVELTKKKLRNFESLKHIYVFTQKSTSLEKVA